MKSQTNSLEFDNKLSARSFTYIRIRSGPNLEPRGTLVLTSAEEEACQLRTTFCFLFLKKLEIKFKRLSDIAFGFSLNIMTSCHTLSNTFDTSRKTLQTSRSSSNDLNIAFVTDSCWLIQESPSLKPD